MNAALILNFLKELSQNNNREWFHSNRDLYLSAKEEVEKFVQSISMPLTAIDPELSGYTDPQTAMFRIFRDIRFSPDKTPYKDYFGIFFAKGGRKVHYPGYYLHIQPESSLVCGGLWMPDSDMLKAVRQEIIYNTDRLQEIITEKNFKKFYGSIDSDLMLKNIPRGYPKDFPFPEYLRTKSFTFSTPLSNEDLCSVDIQKMILERFSAIRPMIAFLNDSIAN